MATTNQIEVFQGNSLTVTCTVSGLESLAGYTCKLYVKNASGDDKIEKTGSVEGLVITFPITADDNNLSAGTYHYEVVIDDDTNFYTVVNDLYVVRESIVY